MTKKTKTLLLIGIVVVLATASGLGIWLMNRSAQTGTGNVLGVAWYDESGTEFTISTADELYELAELSKHYDFKEQTIKLGADITVNEGNAEDWLKLYPKRQWYPIQNFAGTFDGQGHTISGLCGDGTRYKIDKTGKEIVTVPTGMFANTQGKSVIKDLRVVNSLFVSDVDNGVGTITAQGSGTFEKIYSSALLVTYKSHAGGIVGQLNATGNTTITNCWFDGEIRVEGNVGRFIGGIVGRVYECKGQNQIEHCLSTAVMDSPVTGKGVNMGGLIGNVDPKGKVTVTDCLSAAKLTNEYGISVGGAIGCNQGNLIVNDTYAAFDSYKNVVGAVLKDMVGSPVGYDREMLTGEEAYKWTTLDFKKHWAIQKDSTPVLQCFAEEVPSTKGLKKAYDISWYEKNKSTYEISNMKEMYGLAILSYKTNFAGKTVKLAADLTVNEGKAADWNTSAPKTKWIQIGPLGYPFNGVFDGQMHSISGVYQKMTDKNGGIFASTGKGATVKNLKLTNSYFEASEQTIGSIVGTGRGKFNTIYSDAIIRSTHGYVGGIIGQVATDFGIVAENCWFDGEITALGNDPKNRRTAGIVAYIQKDSTLSNCLNTGTIDASVYTATNNAKSTVVAPCVGGLAGDESGSKIKLTITDSLNAGVIKYNEAATAAYGSAVGYSTGQTTLSGVYATKESCKAASGGHVSGQVIVVDEANISGLKGYQWTHLNFEDNWAVVVNPKAGTPILKAFAPETPSVASTHRMVDVSWYNSKDKTFTLDSKEDLFGFYIVSHSDDFKDKTVRLGKNITVNTGNAANWASKAPAYEWKVIGSANHPFAGTFDGRMKTISGLYQNTDERFGGLFATGIETTKIKNLIIANSYFKWIIRQQKKTMHCGPNF